MAELKNKIIVNAKDGELIVRTGEAKPNFKVRKGIDVSGNIEVPLRHLEKLTATELDDDAIVLQSGKESIIIESYLTVDRDAMQIGFKENAGKEYESRYLGTLALDTDFLGFGINDASVTYTTLQLAEKIKMNRSFFEKKTDAMRLVSELRGFEAKVNKEVEAKVDDRANRRVLLAQTVTTNIPESFKMNIPVFKGQGKVILDVEVGIDPYDLSCRLISPEVNDHIHEIKNQVIDEQLDAIRDLHPELRIFEI